ncbi:hypothetical protein DFH28DRAFT_925835 [Melampsora americana]|nr:hypothetical protein DFH28DRAFT_925835 [Melampsora americana]
MSLTPVCGILLKVLSAKQLVPLVDESIELPSSTSPEALKFVHHGSREQGRLRKALSMLQQRGASTTSSRHPLARLTTTHSSSNSKPPTITAPMPCRDLNFGGFDDDLNSNKPSRRQRTGDSPPPMTRDEALRISQGLGLLQHPTTPPPIPTHLDADDGWEDIQDENGLNDEIRPDSPGNQYANHQKSLRRAEARARSLGKWKALESQMTATFLHLQHSTLNWTKKYSYSTNKIKCDGRRRKRGVTFCDCVPDVIRLLHVGYISGSPQFPHTGFSIRLVQFHHQLWNHTVVSTSGFIDALMAFLDERCTSRLSPRPIRGRTQKNINRSLRRPLTQAIDIHRRILANQQSLYEEGLQLSQLDISAARCSACFGPAEGEVKVSPKEPDVIIAMDGNFQHRHQSYASKDSPQEDQYPDFFIRPRKLEEEVVACQQTDAHANNIKTSCSDSHTAANDVRNSTSWDRCDDTGLFAGACRHDVPLHFVNIYKSSEKLYYPVAILKRLRELYPDKFIGVLYDIGCHLGVHITKHGLFPPDNLKMIFGTSVFHAYVHQWACQIKYHPRFNDFWGLSDGEGLERLWSFLSALVAPLCISTRLHQLLAIHWRALFYASKVKEGCGLWLLRRYRNAVKVLGEAQSALNTLFQMANPSIPGEKYSAEFFRSQWASEREAYESKEAVLQKQKLELGRLLSLQDELEAEWSQPALTPQQVLHRLRTTAELKESIAKQAAKVGTTDVLWLEKEQQAFLKLWYSKHEVGLRFIAICEEKRPLQQSRSDGHDTNLGHKGKTHLLVALRKHATQLKKIVETYRTRRAQYHQQYPANQLPPDIDYHELLQIQADHPFWNNSLFTKIQAPWAVDPTTRHGMQQLAYADRAKEELRRLGWEVRRAMRWATTSHDRIWKHFLSLRLEPDSDQNLATPLLSHLTLSHLPLEDRRSAATVIVKNEFVKLTHLQTTWNESLLEVFSQTHAQIGDEDLKNTWKSQLNHISTLREQDKLSMIPGDIETPVDVVMDEQYQVEAAMDEQYHVEAAMEDGHAVYIAAHESDGDSSIDGDDDDSVAGLVHGLDLVDINSAVYDDMK